VFKFWLFCLIVFFLMFLFFVVSLILDLPEGFFFTTLESNSNPQHGTFVCCSLLVPASLPRNRNKGVEPSYQKRGPWDGKLKSLLGSEMSLLSALRYSQWLFSEELRSLKIKVYLLNVLALISQLDREYGHP
jgi:hypothetical protein